MNHDNRTKPEIAHLLALHRSEVKDLERIQQHEQNCRGCIHGDKGKPVRCNKWGVSPPQEVLDVGCDDWRYDSIPFKRGV